MTLVGRERADHLAEGSIRQIVTQLRAANYTEDEIREIVEDATDRVMKVQFDDPVGA